MRLNTLFSLFRLGVVIYFCTSNCVISSSLMEIEFLPDKKRAPATSLRQKIAPARKIASASSNILRELSCDDLNTLCNIVNKKQCPDSLNSSNFSQKIQGRCINSVKIDPRTIDLIQNNDNIVAVLHTTVNSNTSAGLSRKSSCHTNSAQKTYRVFHNEKLVNGADIKIIFGK